MTPPATPSRQNTITGTYTGQRTRRAGRVARTQRPTTTRPSRAGATIVIGIAMLVNAQGTNAGGVSPIWVRLRPDGQAVQPNACGSYQKSPTSPITVYRPQ